MNENNKTTLTEEQLEHAAGGGLTDQVGCHFVHKNGKLRTRVLFDGYDPVYEAECGGTCHGFGNGGNRCLCHGSEHCVNRWHMVTKNGSPVPNEDKHKHWYS